MRCRNTQQTTPGVGHFLVAAALAISAAASRTAAGCFHDEYRFVEGRYASRTFRPSTVSLTILPPAFCDVVNRARRVAAPIAAIFRRVMNLCLTFYCERWRALTVPLFSAQPTSACVNCAREVFDSKRDIFTHITRQ